MEMLKTYRVTLTFVSTWDGLVVTPFTGVMTWKEDAEAGVPTPESVVSNFNDGQSSEALFKAVSCSAVEVME